MKLSKLVVLVLVLIPGSILAASCLENTPPANNIDLKAANNCITQKDVTNAQETWANAIVAIGKAYKNGEDYKALAADTVDQLYGYDEGKVLFKPTKASEGQFRLTEKDAISYFVKGVVSEDKGFALQPWSKVRFENAGISLDCTDAVTMGNYYFTDAKTGKETKVEYTFGYRKNMDGKLLIDLHHSSVPYNPTEQ
ncbi:hypothetical protein [Rivularia sp. UHCC 0363]|uniref:hypothetical protein n=1 Tax=Rivularia sp. UHCC 0363 TaxID=3110244 RepID=UPI002B200E9C|nr:hypothetical protein [Rivularia sp. UHCC 0363]MEA5594259.1 hypothetical protein [Rivularia sp. UHCC 0363]